MSTNDRHSQLFKVTLADQLSNSTGHPAPFPTGLLSVRVWQETEISMFNLNLYHAEVVSQSGLQKRTHAVGNQYKTSLIDLNPL